MYHNIDNPYYCLLYTSDAADDLLCVDLGGRRIIKKKTTTDNPNMKYRNTAISLDHQCES